MERFACALSTMSCRRRGTRLEGKLAVPVDFGLKARLADRLLDHIDPAAQDSGQALFQMLQPAEVVEAMARKIV